MRERRDFTDQYKSTSDRMKTRLLLIFANFLFRMGDLCSRLAFKFDSGFFYDLYQWFMHKSERVQDKYNLPGPWKEVEHNGDIESGTL